MKKQITLYFTGNYPTECADRCPVANYFRRTVPGSCTTAVSVSRWTKTIDKSKRYNIQTNTIYLMRVVIGVITWNSEVTNLNDFFLI